MKKKLKICVVASCKRKFYGKDLCFMHYLRWRRNGTLERKYKVGQPTGFSRFNGLRNVALERDNWECVVCGMNNEQHIVIFGRAITVDHIDGNGRNSKAPNNTLENLQTLCLRCHGKKDRQRRRSFYELPASSRKKMLANLKYFGEKEVKLI